jgi:hypothetical protein
MSFEEMYPTLRTQAYFAVMRYDPLRKDKMQELISMAYVKYKKDIESCREPNLNIYKSFISKRSREIDFRSLCRKGMGVIAQAMLFLHSEEDQVKKLK